MRTVYALTNRNNGAIAVHVTMKYHFIYFHGIRNNGFEPTIFSISQQNVFGPAKIITEDVLYQHFDLADQVFI